MAGEDYTSGLNILLEGTAKAGQVRTQSPEADIQNVYEAGMEQPTGFDAILRNVNSQPEQNERYDRLSTGRAASQLSSAEYAPLDQMREGPAPDQELVDPSARFAPIPPPIYPAPVLANCVAFIPFLPAS